MRRSRSGGRRRCYTRRASEPSTARRPRRARRRRDRARARRSAARSARRRRAARRAADGRVSRRSDEASRDRRPRCSSSWSRRGAPRGVELDVGDRRFWVAAERLPEIRAVHPDAIDRAGDRGAAVARDARLDARRGDRRAAARPPGARSGRRPRATLAASLAIDEADADAALLALEARRRRAARAFVHAAERCGAIARAVVRPAAAGAHPSLHAESPARRDRAGQPGRLHALPVRLAARRRRRSRLTGLDGLRAVVDALDGFELRGGGVGARASCRRASTATSRRCSTCCA